MLDMGQIRRIHCIGIGGIGLSAIADILVARGYEVSGSDMNHGEKIEQLMDDGVTVYLGHRAKNVEGADLVVYSAAVGADNPEIVRAKELGIPCITRGKMLGILMDASENSIAISGTHGKTTTTSMISLIMKNAKLDPTILVGGNLKELTGGNVEVGSDEYFVTEACEYMDSYLELAPKMEIILNIDSDHLDYFKDIEHIVQSFEKFTNLLPEDGCIVAYDANPFVKQVIQGKDNVITFGISSGCDYYAEDLKFNDRGCPGFSVYHKGEQGPEKLAHVQLAIPGEHNVLNALAAFACCNTFKVPVDVIVSTLEAFTGTQRRFDVLGETQDGMRIVDDYAHHPTEIEATLKAAERMQYRKLWVIFQPHTYTRTIALFDEFPAALSHADNIIYAEIYAAREKNIHKISSKELMVETRRRYPDKDVYFFEDFDDIANFVYNHADPEDLVITMGAGDVYKVGEMILEKDGATRGRKIR